MSPTLTGTAYDRAAAIAERCAKAKQHGKSWKACCPAHDDTNPSLSITYADAKGVGLKCHKGCSLEQIVAALGLTLSDLFVPSQPNGHRRIVKVYDYYDAQGTLVHQTVRYDPKDFKQRRPHPVHTGDYIWQDVFKDIEPVLYNLPAVLAAVARGETIYVTEGEKDADTLIRHGLVATTNPMGGGNWHDRYSPVLRGVPVIIFRDNDDKGHKHVVQVAKSLDGIAARITIVTLPGLPPKGDVTDWLQGGKMLDDLHHEISTTPEGLSSYLVREAYELNHTENLAPFLTEKSSQGLSSLNSLSSYLEWPTLGEEALYGLTGDIVETITPHSEADPVALLMQLLEYFGAILGRQAYYQVEATKHYTNLNCCLVGPTAKGRKGTAYDIIEWLMQQVDSSWTTNNISGGCGSGEGLIAAVRDKTIKREPIKVKGKVTGYEEVETDAGVIDKRLLVYEAEFSSVLKVAGREGNILSEILRKAWETGNLRNTVKNNPLKATGAHIAITGHITVDELQRTLTTTDAANGFGNRFLWLLVRRSKRLPDGGAFQTIDFQPLLKRLREVFAQAKTVHQMRRDAAAREAWHAVYERLSDERPGLVGTLLARAEAQVLRLSMLYALLDGTETIAPEHLNAALAIWEYVEASVAYIFGTSLGDPVADTLLAALQESETPSEGLCRKQILSEVFHGNLRADELDRVLRFLEQRKIITRTSVPPEGGRGRPKEMVAAIPYELNEFNELNQSRYISLSNDAVKAMGLSSYGVRTKYELNGTADPEPCLHEHVDDAGRCNDCGADLTGGAL